MRISVACTLLLSCFVALTGCGTKGEQKLTVSGNVLVAGQPLPDGAIKFLPVDPNGKSMSGTTIKTGAFTIPAENGLFPGKYRVEISAASQTAKTEEVPGGIKLAKETIPAKYNRNSTLTAEVTSAGNNVFEFKLD